MDDRKKVWEEYGAKDAYWAVVTLDEFRDTNLDADAKDSFFRSGYEHIAGVWRAIEEKFGIELRPQRALDYGCGVGRLLVPMSERCASVTGVDISENMLAETRRNLGERGAEGFRLLTDKAFMEDAGRYDFVHTFIVLQHIDPAIGYKVIARMLEMLEPGGYGMIHVTYKDLAPAWRKFRGRIYRDVPSVHKIVSAVTGRKGSFIPTYEYDAARVRSAIKSGGGVELFTAQTDHGLGGEMIFVSKPSDKE
ncbi:MAG TPA: class I SAM-dependent methyltransferase [Pyrinomonadaceae bacterium]|mgnify:CR=1 FL=1|nr:class I SAM-dependent methyltransferase [Pyrinomonadaceae bacterium]